LLIVGLIRFLLTVVKMETLTNLRRRWAVMAL